MSWETITLVAIVVGAGLAVISLVAGFILTLSFIRRIKARPAKGKAKTKEKAADEGYGKREQSLLAEMAERLSVIEADTTLKLDNFHRRLLGLTRGRQEGEGRGPRRGAAEDSSGDEWERVPDDDPDAAAAVARGDYALIGDDGQPVAPDAEPVAEVGPVGALVGSAAEQRKAEIRTRGPAKGR